MSRKKITAVIPIRKGSQRVPNKNFKDFWNGKSLLELKIESLIAVKTIDDIVVNTDSEIAIEIAKSYGINYHRRDDYFASSECSQSEFFHNLAETTDSDLILHTPCTSPFIKTNTYYDLINRFLISNHDSGNTVGLVKEYLWLNGNPLNYDVSSKVPNSQDLPDVMKLTFGVNIIHREIMLERKNVIGYNPLFYVVDGIEETDIDTKLDFDTAQCLYQKFLQEN
jgi:CMP-N-acetylneuraminic acid synthetase